MIDAKRLATDAEYWDSVAPEGATRYDERYLHPWRRSEEGCELYFSAALQNWVSTSRRKDSEGIPRPKAPEADWHGSGKPIIGSEVEAAWRVENGEMSGFRPVLIKGFFPEVDGRAQVWFCTTEGEDIVRLNVNCNFRPIRTQAERERNEAEGKALKEVYARIGDDNLVRTIKATVSALYDAGLLRKGDS